jgi:hypothetical protein
MTLHIGTRRRTHFGPRLYFTHPLAIFAVLLVIGVFFAVIAFGVVQRQNQYASEGVATQATVIDKDTYTRSTRNNINRYYEATYQYTVGDQTYTATHNIDRAAYESLAAGDSLDILYMANNPADSVPAGYQNGVLPLVIVGAALLVNGVALGYGALQLLRRR